MLMIADLADAHESCVQCDIEDPLRQIVDTEDPAGPLCFTHAGKELLRADSFWNKAFLRLRLMPK